MAMNSDTNNPQAAELLDSAKGAVQRSIDMIRAICGELRPPTLAPFGLEKAILAHIDRLKETYRHIHFHSELIPDRQTLPEHVRMALYRIYQHAVSNVIRHAEAKNVTVVFTLDARQILLKIQDDGRGFVLPNRWVEYAREGHLGLIGTSERAAAIGGRLDILSEPGQGTTIQVVVPLQTPVGEQAAGGFEPG
jgi:signal transduction histidine kinase